MSPTTDSHTETVERLADLLGPLASSRIVAGANENSWAMAAMLCRVPMPDSDTRLAVCRELKRRERAGKAAA